MFSRLYGKKYYPDPHSNAELIDLSLTKINSCFNHKEDVFMFVENKYAKLGNSMAKSLENPLRSVELFLIGEELLKFSESKTIVKKLLKHPKSLSSKNLFCIGDDNFINKIEAILTSFNFDCHVTYLPTNYKTLFHLLRFSKNYIEHHVTSLPLRYSTYYSKTILLHQDVLEFNKDTQTSMYIQFLKIAMLFDEKLFHEILSKIPTLNQSNFNKIFMYFIKKFEKNKKLDRFFFGSVKNPMILCNKKFYNFATEYLAKYDIKSSPDIVECSSIMINLLIGAKLKITPEKLVNQVLKAFSNQEKISQALLTITNHADWFYLDFKQNQMNGLFIKKPGELKYFKNEKRS